MQEIFTVGYYGNGKRLDVFIARKLKGTISRTKVKDCIKSGSVTVNGAVVTSAHHAIAEGDELVISFEIEQEAAIDGIEMPLDIVHEDDDCIVVNKPAGLVVHPGAGVHEATLAHGLVWHFQHLSTVGGNVRPGIVHRIDKDTSGLLIVAKNDAAHAHLANQFKEHTNTRRYYAVVKGVVQHDEGCCDAAIGTGKVFRKKMIVEAADGRHAVTYYKVVERFQNATLLELTLETGRTHQIRVHMAYLGHPVMGDAMYGQVSQAISRQALHARVLGFEHPRTGEYLEFEVPVPEDMRKLIAELKG